MRQREWTSYVAAAHKGPAFTGGIPVADIVYLAVGLAFFAVMAIYGTACARL